MERLAGTAVTLRGMFVRSVTPSQIQDVGDSPRVSYGVQVANDCSLSLTDFVVDDAGWGFVQTAGSLGLTRGLVSRWTDGPGASNGASGALAPRIDSVRFSPAGRVATDVILPETLLPPPPAPCAMPPCAL